MKVRAESLLDFDKKRIKDAYLKHKTITGVINDTGFGYKVARKVLVSSGIIVEKSTKHKKDFTIQEIDCICIDHSERGYSMQSLANKYKTTVDVVRNILNLDVDRAPRCVEFSSVSDVMTYCARFAARNHGVLCGAMKPTKLKNPNNRFTWYSMRTNI